MNILRGSRVKQSSKRANDFTSSIGFDAPLTKHVVMINMAHMLALLRSGEVGRREGSACLRFLAALPADVKLDRGAEDVHQSLEQQAIRAIGMEAAGFLNLGKSRNDQVSTALRMEVRSRLIELVGEISRLQQTILQITSRDRTLAIPGYTHLQRAQPTTLFHHYQSHFEAVGESLERIMQLYGRVNLSPMGAAALAGTSVKVDRKTTASLLGFDGLVQNSMFAVSSRGFALETLTCLELLMTDLSKMAEEIILWSSTEFGFIEVGDEYSATSSIMPQKKNPVVAETIRAKCGSVIGEATAAFVIAKALPQAYNLDLQEITPHLWRAIADTIGSTSMMVEMLASIKFNRSKLTQAVRGDTSTATELANELVRAHGLPFRQAHQIVGELVRLSLNDDLTLEKGAELYLGSVSKRIAGRAIKIDKARLGTVLDALKTLELIQSAGGANPRFIKQQVLKDRKAIRATSKWLRQHQGALDESRELLRDEVRSYLKEVKN